MSQKACPSEEEVLSFVDSALAPEQLQRIEAHVSRCPACQEQVRQLRSLISAIAAPLPSSTGAGFDVASHVAGVMERLDEPPRKPERLGRLRWGMTLTGFAAAAAVLFLMVPRGPEREETFTARGGVSEASLSRDVGLQLYAQDTSLHRLSPGSRVSSKSALTAGLRNLSAKPAHLLLFAVDARGNVHWISPQFVDPKSNPVSTVIKPSAQETLLTNAVVFDDLAPGVLRVMALISEQPARVSQVEALAADQLNAESLIAQFPHVEIRQVALQITNE